MPESRHCKTVMLAMLTMMLAACGSTRSMAPSSSSTAGMSASDIYQATRYDIQQDRGPDGPFDVSRVRPVVPVAEPRTIAGNKNPYTVNGRTYRVMASEEGYRERGFASWYGAKFHGHKTSNGEIYDMFQLSAAHRSMPIPGYLRVTNLENDRSIIVRVNDRGPFHNDRVVDLSYAAAYMLGFHDKGTAMVEIEAVIPGANPVNSPVLATHTPTSPVAPSVAVQPSATTTGATTMAATTRAAPASATGQYLQVGAFADLATAQRLIDKLRTMTSRPVFIRSIDADNTTLHRVRIGPIPEVAEISRITELVVAADLGSPYTVRD